MRRASAAPHKSLLLVLQIASSVLERELEQAMCASTAASSLFPPSTGGAGPGSDLLLACQVCGATLKGKQTLREHIRGTHLALYSYRCRDCGLAFKWRSTLKNHRVQCAAASRSTAGMGGGGGLPPGAYQ